MTNLLPLGSIVTIKNSMAKMMILGYYLIDKKDNKCYQYAGVIYPSGIPETNNFVLFNNKDIKEVIFKGYSTPESEAVLSELFKKWN